MLSRTADNLYWLARYVERAEYLARILDAAYRALVAADVLWRRAPTNGKAPSRPPAAAAASSRSTTARRTSATVIDFLAFSPRQSVLDPQLLRDGPHQRARGAHGAHQRDVGRDQRRLARAAASTARPDRPRGRSPLPRLGEGASRCASTARPTARCCATTPTASRGSACIIERADNTARILDVKYHVLLPRRKSGRRRRSTISSGRRSCARSRR